MREFDAVLCDLDGTLVDSEVLHLGAWRQVLHQEGLTPPDNWEEEVIAKTDDYTRDRLVERFPQFADRDILKEKQTLFREMLKGKGREFAYPGVHEALARLRDAGIAIAVGTNGVMENVELSLDAAELREFIQAIVTLEMVASPKPAPDIYLEAARRLGADPMRCCVIEDTATGLKSANSAGCRALAVTNSWPAERLSMADEIFTSTSDALEWVLGGE